MHPADLPLGVRACHDELVVETLIKELRDAIDGEVTDKARVIDHLLDLRLAGHDQPALVECIDEVLVDVPGKTTVANGWWLGTLHELDRVQGACGSPAAR